MKTTLRGEAFIARMEIVNAMVRAGTPFFVAMAAGLEDDDWILAYAAVRTMARELESQNANQDANLAAAVSLQERKTDV
jgi:hypothetical protein